MAYLVHIGRQMEVKSFSWHDLNREQMSMNNMKRQKKRSKNMTQINKNKKTQIIMYDIYNKTLQQLTTAKDDHYFQDISPDNKRILFLANLDEDSDYTLRNDLYELEFTSNDIKKLTNEKHDYNKANYSP